MDEEESPATLSPCVLLEHLTGVLRYPLPSCASAHWYCSTGSVLNHIGHSDSHRRKSVNLEPWRVGLCPSVHPTAIKFERAVLVRIVAAAQEEDPQVVQRLPGQP